MNDTTKNTIEINTIQNRKITTAVGRNICFWGYSVLETIGIILATAAGLFIFFTLGNGDFSSDQKIQHWLAVFPYYLYLGGGFSILMTTIGYFQVYFSLLVSMNNKRTTVAAGIMGSALLLIAVVNAGAWLIWKLIPIETAEIAVQLIPVFAGSLLITGAFSLLLGAIMIRWGKIGTIIMTCVCMVIGAMFGLGLAAADNIMELILRFAGKNMWAAVAAGLILYGLSGVSVMRIIRKVEIRG